MFHGFGVHVALLHRVCKFMGDQPLPVPGMRLVFVLGKHNVLPYRESSSIKFIGKVGGLPICKDANVGKIMGELRLDKSSSRHIKRLPLVLGNVLERPVFRCVQPRIVVLFEVLLIASFDGLAHGFSPSG